MEHAHCSTVPDPRPAAPDGGPHAWKSFGEFRGNFPGKAPSPRALRIERVHIVFIIIYTKLKGEDIILYIYMILHRGDACLRIE